MEKKIRLTIQSILILFSLLVTGLGFTQTTKPPVPGKWARDFAAGPELIFHNANLITLDDANPWAEAIAVDGNRISALGSNVDILAQEAAHTLVIDLEGRTVMPGFIEGHSHIPQRGFVAGGIEGLKNAALVLAADGYTTVHDMTNGDHDVINAAVELAQQNELAVRMNFYMAYNNVGGGYIEGNWNSLPYTTEVDTMVRIVGVKMFMDGGLVNRPCLSTQYLTDGTYGDCYFSPEDCNAAVQTVLDAGYPIAAHALGDSALGIYIDALELAFSGQGNTLRSRVEHARFTRNEQIQKMADNGITASIQYTWAMADRKERYEGIYSAEALEYCYPWRQFADQSVPILGGNDAPWASRWTHALQTVSAVVTWQDQPGDVPSGWMEGKQLTLDEAIRGMTVNNAWICFEENDKGTLAVGKLADITVFSTDPYSVDPYDVRYITVEMTVVDGVIRYNQLGNIHQAVHDIGAFQIGIDDRGFWGPFRALVGLRYGGSDHLAQGSLMISYDDNTIATALRPQFDYQTSENGGVRFYEPGMFGDQDCYLMFEDAYSTHPGPLQVRQNSYMWEGDSSLLVKYLIRNIGTETVSDLYFGQFMDLDIEGWSNYGRWDDSEQPGFGYMYNPDVNEGPYIGMAMFDTKGEHVNTSWSFPIPVLLFEYNEENFHAGMMRSGIFQYETPGTYDYALFPAAGPYTIEPNQSISPFFLSISVGDDPDDLRSSVQHAVMRSGDMSLYTVYHDIPYDVIPDVDPARLSLDLYVPGESSTEPRPVLIYIHGGGWKQGNKGVLYFKRDYFIRQGYILASINYRLSPNGPPYSWDPNRVMHPDHATDAGSAVAYIYENITGFGGDSSRIALMGFSAGCHLAALVSTDEQYLGAHGVNLSAIKATVGLDGAAYDLPTRIPQLLDNSLDTYLNAFGTDTVIWKDASPTYHVDQGKGIPPFLLINTDDAERMEVVNMFVDSLTADGVRVDTWSAGGLSHLYVDYHAGDVQHAMTPVITDFLADCLDYGTDVEENKPFRPLTPCLYQNTPNPFNPVTEIAFEIVRAGPASLTVYDILGRKVRTLLDKPLLPGMYRIPFNATHLPSGVYFYTLRAGNHIETKKCLLIR